MFRRPLLSLTIILFAFDVQSANETELSPGLVNPGYHDKPAWFKSSFLDLYEDIDEAAEQGKRVMLYFYQDGCPYCKKLLQDNFGQRGIADKTKKYFDVVAINIWGDREVVVGDKTTTEKKLAEAFKVQYTPTLLFFDSSKKTVFRANGYYPPQKFTALLDYIGTAQEKQLSYQEYMQKVDPQPATGKLHVDATNIEQTRDLKKALRKGRHLLVMFEQKQCATCDELHLDILRRNESLKQLEKLDVVVLDMWSEDRIVRPDGIESSIYEWARSLGINYAPSMVYFDDSGKEVFRSDAYLKSFHIQSVMDYVSSSSYETQPNFQRYIDARADALRARGIEVNLMD